MKGLVSAIVPTFNYGRFVARAVTSALTQTYAPLECIVVDDGSDDDTLEVLRRFGRDVRVIRQSHRGVSAARNAAIAAARGEFIALLDGDDQWHPPKLETQIEVLTSRPELGCLGCGLEHVTPDGRVDRIPGRRNKDGRGMTLRNVARRRYWIGGSGSGAVMRRTALDRVGPFDERLAAAEDWDMWMRFAAACDIDNAEPVLVSIFRHGSGVFRNAALVEQAQWSAYNKSVATWPDVLTQADRRQMRAMILADAARELTQPRARALRYYVRSLTAWPFHARRAREAAVLAVRLCVSATTMASVQDRPAKDAPRRTTP